MGKLDALQRIAEQGMVTGNAAEVISEVLSAMEPLLALAAAVLRAVPDATPERVEALLRVGLAVEQSKADIRAATLAEAVQAVDALRPGPEHHYDEARGFRDGINAALEALGRLG